MGLIQEKNTVSIMIDFYCKRNHNTFNGLLCSECAELKIYANERLDKCTFGDNKPACSKCLVHCYKPIMREQIRKIMRYSGPRMIYAFPIHYIKHWLKLVRIGNVQIVSAKQKQL
jgi:hypothetical protein